MHLYWQLDLERWHANRITTMKTSIQTSFATKSFQTRFKCYLFTQMNHSFSTSISLELLLNKHALFRFNIIVRLMAIGLSVLRLQKKKKKAKWLFYLILFRYTFLALTQLSKEREVRGRNSKRIELPTWVLCMNHISCSGCGPTLHKGPTFPMYTNTTRVAWLYSAKGKGKGQTWGHCRDFQNHHKSHFNSKSVSKIKVRRLKVSFLKN